MITHYFGRGLSTRFLLNRDLKSLVRAEDGDEALSMIRTMHPQVAVVDINLPGMNGQQITHQVVQDKLPTRIVLLTAYDDHEQIIHAAWAGAAAYCAKDIDPMRLIQTVKEVADGKFVIENHVYSQKELDQLA